MSAPRVSARDRFWTKVDKTETCWLWTAALSDQGYGTFHGDREETGRPAPTIGAHRWAYEQNHGPVPDGLVLDHLCRVRHCVRPDHLEPVSDRTNLLRGVSFSAVNAKKTHCPRGHELVGDNLLPGALKRGDRNCWTCQNERNERNRQKTAPVTVWEYDQ